MWRRQSSRGARKGALGPEVDERCHRRPRAFPAWGVIGWVHYGSKGRVVEVSSDVDAADAYLDRSLPSLTVRRYVSSMTIAPGAELGTVLGVWAHPDDEAYLSSGLMAQAAAAGSRVVCVTATRGEGGSLDPERWPPHELGDVRAAELQRCLSMLGVQEHIFLDLADVDWHTALSDEGAVAVDTIMARVAPNTVLTFGPDGITNHEGHKSVSR